MIIFYFVKTANHTHHITCCIKYSYSWQNFEIANRYCLSPETNMWQWRRKQIEMRGLDLSKTLTSKKKGGGASVGVMYNFAEKDPPVPTPMCGSATCYYIWHICKTKHRYWIAYISTVYFLISPFSDNKVYCKAEFINW